MVEEEFRLQVFLAKKDIGSRRFCENLIREGKVRLNGKIAVLGSKVKLGDRVEYKGRIFVCKNISNDYIYVALNKPANYLSSHKDDFGRRLSINLVQPLFPQRLFSVGRLDYKSTGLLIFTNDGNFANSLLHPRLEVEKEYIIESKKDIPLFLLEKFKKGINIDGIFMRLKSYEMINERVAKLILIEGKNREIRKVFESINLFLKKLHRTRIANITLGSLKLGELKTIPNKLINNLKNTL